MLTRNQRYAAQIYEQVNQIAQEWEHDKPKRDKYGSMAHKLPLLIHTAGLAQALAFVESRGSAEQQRLLDHIAQVVGLTDRKSLVRRSREARQLTAYMRLTRDVLAALVWFKRFAQSVLDVDPTATTEGGGNE